MCELTSVETVHEATVSPERAFKSNMSIGMTHLSLLGFTTGFTLSRDEDVHATVVSGNKVDFEGQIMSLSASALSALHKLGGYTLGAASGRDLIYYRAEPAVR